MFTLRNSLLLVILSMACLSVEAEDTRYLPVTGSAWRLALGDVNGDDRQELICGLYQGAVSCVDLGAGKTLWEQSLGGLPRDGGAGEGRFGPTRRLIHRPDELRRRPHAGRRPRSRHRLGHAEIRIRRQPHRLDRQPPPERPIAALIDGKKPSEHPELYGFTRALPKPGGPWPVVADLSSEKPLLVEEWTMNVVRDPANEDLYTFKLSGSKTGPDGSGRSDTRFVSPSGRVVIDPEDWDVSYALGLAGVKPVPANFTARWRVVPRHVDQWQPAASQPGIENVVTLAHGLEDRPHTLELTGDLSALAAVRVHSPRQFPTNGTASPTE